MACAGLSRPRSGYPRAHAQTCHARHGPEGCSRSVEACRPFDCGESWAACIRHRTPGILLCKLRAGSSEGARSEPAAQHFHAALASGTEPAAAHAAAQPSVVLRAYPRSGGRCRTD